MSKGVAFWLVFLVVLVFCLWVGWPWGIGSLPLLVLFILIGLLGWAVFGRPVQ